jgi:hypothetical protein
MWEHSEEPATTPPHEFAALKHILLGDLRELLDEPLDSESRKWLLAVLDVLLDMLPCQFANEEFEGEVDRATIDDPAFQEHVGELRQQQEILYDDLFDLRTQLARDGSAGDSDDIRGDLRQWLEQYERHENQDGERARSDAEIAVAG